MELGSGIYFLKLSKINNKKTIPLENEENSLKRIHRWQKSHEDIFNIIIIREMKN